MEAPHLADGERPCRQVASMNGACGAADHPPRRRNRRRPLALALLFAVPTAWVAVAIWLLVVGLGIRSQTGPVSGWPQTSGRITAVRVTDHTYDRSQDYYPIIAFRDGGRIITFEGPVTSTPPSVGALIRVTFNPGNPHDAHDLSMGSAWKIRFYGAIGLLVPGIAFMAFVGWLVIVRPRSARGAAKLGAVASEGRHVRSR